MNKSQIYIVVAALGFSFILIFSTLLKQSGMSSFEQLFFRLCFGILLLYILLLPKKRVRFPEGKDIVFFVSIGFVYSMFALMGLSSVAYDVPIAVAVALIYTQPIFTAILSHVTGKEKATPFRTGVILIGVAGAFLVTGLQQMNVQANVGLVFPIIAGFFYALYLWLKRQASKKQNYTPYQVLHNTLLFALPPLLFSWLVFRGTIANPLLIGVTAPDLWQLLLLLSFAAFSTILPYALLNYVRPDEISPTQEGLLLLGDPLLHTLWAALLFEQFVTTTQYLGAALVLGSAAISLKLSSS